MADTLEENYLLEEQDAVSVVGSDDGAVSVQDEPVLSNEASEDAAPAPTSTQQESKDEAARKLDKKRKRKEKEKARKQKVGCRATEPRLTISPLTPSLAPSVHV
jgi:protein CMS1